MKQTDFVTSQKLPELLNQSRRNEIRVEGMKSEK